MISFTAKNRRKGENGKMYIISIYAGVSHMDDKKRGFVIYSNVIPLQLFFICTHKLKNIGRFYLEMCF